MSSCKILLAPDNTANVIFRNDSFYYVVNVPAKDASIVSAFMMLASEHCKFDDEALMNSYIGDLLNVVSALRDYED